MTIASYPIVSEIDEQDGREHRRSIRRVLNNAMRGKINIGVEFQLTNVAQTVVTDLRIHPGCMVFFDPLDDVAEEILRTGPFYADVDDRVDGQLTVTHAEGNQGASFRMAILS